MAWMQGHGGRGALLSLFSCACLEATSSANAVPRCPAAVKVAVEAEPGDTPALPAPTAVDGVIAALPAEAAPEGAFVTSPPASHLERLDVIPALPPPDPGAPSMSPVAEREPGRLVWLRAREAMGLLAIDPTESPYKAHVPRDYTTCGPFGSTLQICVSEAGDVTSMHIVRPSIPVLDLQLRASDLSLALHTVPRRWATDAVLPRVAIHRPVTGAPSARSAAGVRLGRRRQR